MPVPATHDTRRFIFCLALFITIVGLPSQLAAADNNFLSKISPHVEINQQSPSGELPSFSLHQAHPEDDDIIQRRAYTPPAKSMSDQDLFSLALGARFQLSDWLGFGAACTMPLAEQEAVRVDDLAIEAMVTMQF